MAEVFDGRSLGSHGFEKRVAIKRILPELAGDQTFTSRLVVEAKLAVAMQHVNIVQALDLVRDGRDVFLVMEFVNGPTLRRLLQERYAAGAGPLPLGLSTFLLHEAAAGLDYAHTQPGGAVIHADISPSNLLISRAGEVKLADFGIARREGIARAAEGKWGYMAPEQERGAPLSPRADLYALGVVFYELLTGVHPFASRSARSPRVEVPLIAPHTVRPDLPRPLSDLCCSMLATAVFERPASAREVVDRLAELRYQNGWREGRSELAAAVAIVPELVAPQGPLPTGMTGAMPAVGGTAVMTNAGAMGGTGTMAATGAIGAAGPMTAAMTSALPAPGMPARVPTGVMTSAASYPSTGASASWAADAQLPPRQATEHTAHPLRNATEMDHRPLTLVTSSLLAERGEMLGPSGPAVGTGTPGVPLPPGAVLMSPVPGALSAVPGAMPGGPGAVLMSPVPGALRAPGERPTGPAAPSDALAMAAGGAPPPGTWTSTDAIGGRSWATSSSVRTWLVLGAAALVGVLWGITSVVRDSNRAAPVEEPQVALVAPPSAAGAGEQRPASGQQAAGADVHLPGAAAVEPPAGGAAAQGGAVVAGVIDAGGAGPAAGAAGATTAADPAATTATDTATDTATNTPTAIPDVAASSSSERLGTSGAPPAAGGTSSTPGNPNRPVGGRPASAPSRPEAGDAGTLRVYAEPWAYVQVGDVRVETPARITLRPGQHVVKLSNPELRLTRTEKVRIRSKEMTTLKVRWNE